MTACFFGDGAVAEGEFHECMNLAALWSLPVLFCCENNLYAMGTAIERYESETDLALKAASYEMTAWSVDGMDVLAVEDAARKAAAEVRDGGRPCFLELRTYRFRAHSMYDPDLYRTKEEIERWKQHDPIPALIERLQARRSCSATRIVEELERTIAQEIDAAIAFAEAGNVRAGRGARAIRLLGGRRRREHLDRRRPRSPTARRCARRSARRCSRTSACS